MKTIEDLRLNIIDFTDAHQAEVMRMSREEISEGHLMERSNKMIKQLIGYIEEYASLQQPPKESGEIKSATILTMMADFIKTADVAASELSEVKATMFVNFGDGQKRNPQLVTLPMSAHAMFLKIIEHYHPKTAPTPALPDEGEKVTEEWKSCSDCKYDHAESDHDRFWCRDCRDHDRFVSKQS